MTTEWGDAAPYAEVAPHDDSEPGPFDLYETAAGPRHVGNPVRRLILGKMRGAELTVPEMIDATGLTKSTISAHLALLHKDGMVAYREDPEDRRRKLYYLTARHVGSTRRCREQVDFHAPGFKRTAAAPRIDRLLLRSLLAQLASCGLDLAPVVHETGRRVGELAGAGQRCDSVTEWAEAAGRFWKEAGLGTLDLVGVDPPVVQVSGCELCFDGADARMSLCQVSAGLVEGMASEALQTLVEVDVRAPDGPVEGGCRCTFELHITTPAPDPPVTGTGEVPQA